MTKGEKLRRLRGNRTKKVVAEAIGVSLSSYVKYERDERVPRDDVKVKISDYYKVEVQEIFFES